MLLPHSSGQHGGFMKKVKLTSLIKKADKLFSEVIRSRGECEKCGSKTNLQCAHIISRTNKHLRWDESNALCLCFRCHFFWFHRNPLDAVEWIKKYYPIRYEFLLREKNIIAENVGISIHVTISELERRIQQIAYKNIIEKPL